VSFASHLALRTLLPTRRMNLSKSIRRGEASAAFQCSPVEGRFVVAAAPGPGVRSKPQHTQWPGASTSYPACGSEVKPWAL
jgi:hypothetical protein